MSDGGALGSNYHGGYGPRRHDTGGFISGEQRLEGGDKRGNYDKDGMPISPRELMNKQRGGPGNYGGSKILDSSQFDSQYANGPKYMHQRQNDYNSSHFGREEKIHHYDTYHN